MEQDTNKDKAMLVPLLLHPAEDGELPPLGVWLWTRRLYSRWPRGRRAEAAEENSEPFGVMVTLARPGVCNSQRTTL
jgi:hypothetical protein